jgi:hypothetical protein
MRNAAGIPNRIFRLINYPFLDPIFISAFKLKTEQPFYRFNSSSIPWGIEEAHKTSEAIIVL